MGKLYTTDWICKRCGYEMQIMLCGALPPLCQPGSRQHEYEPKKVTWVREDG